MCRVSSEEQSHHSMALLDGSSGGWWGWCFIKSLWNKHWIKGGPARGPRDSARGPRDPGQHAPTPSIIQVQRNPCSNKKEKNVAHTTKKWKSEVSECSTNTPLVPLPIGHTASGRLLTSRFDLTPVPSTSRLIGLIGVLIRGCNNPNVSITKSRTTPLQPKQLEPYMTGCSEVAKTKKTPWLISVNSGWNITQLSWTHQYVMECHKGLQHSSILCLEEWRLAPSMKTRAHKIPISKRFFQETILQAQIDSSVDFVKEVLNNTPRFFRFSVFGRKTATSWLPQGFNLECALET